MNEKQVQGAIKAAEEFSILTYDPCVMEFWTGYIRGLKRHLHGTSFGTDEEHAQWMELTSSKDEAQQRRGIGYSAGFNGVSIEDAQIMAEEGRIMPP